MAWRIEFLRAAERKSEKLGHVHIGNRRDVYR